MRGAVTGDGGGRDIEEDDQESKPSPWEEGERELANANGGTARHEPCCCATEHSGASVEGPVPIVRATKKGSAKTASVNNSQQTKLMPTRTSSGPKMIMVVVSVR
ncbi:hypothetical protein XH88_08850 [Bradyrhizobium sp. CCBAU 51627]|nr:hypothetical protein [Bradyrhizobium sp. CCBAU 51627]RXH34550.1 hypothetical protein XH84_06690 [Bradyrhizobium nanningense]